MKARRLKRALDWRLRAVVERLDALRASTRRIEAELGRVDREHASMSASLVAMGERLEHASAMLEQVSLDATASRTILEDRLEPALRAVLAEDAQNRRRLFALRAATDYDAAFVELQPLISITVPTHDRSTVLVERALGSILAQTYSRIEAIVVGDASPPDVERAVESLADERVRFVRLNHRVVAHPDPRRNWLVGSTMARNEAARHARGRWLLHFDDDDHLRPDALAELLALAQRDRVEVVYGGFAEHRPDGTERIHRGFPPEPGTFGWQGALIHGGLRFFERELVSANLGVPGDQYLLERMLRAGVAFGMLDALVWDYFPSQLWDPAAQSATIAQMSSTSPAESVE